MRLKNVDINYTSLLGLINFKYEKESNEYIIISRIYYLLINPIRLLVSKSAGLNVRLSRLTCSELVFKLNDVALEEKLKMKNLISRAYNFLAYCCCKFRSMTL